MKNFIEELGWRKMLQDFVPGTEDLLSKEMVIGYIGFDPTADSLGVGNLVQIMTLTHFQRCGHKPIALVGGATGMVGDPSGKSLERNLISETELNHNLACQKAQLEKFLNFDCGINSAEIVNNYDWFKDFSFLNFIRDIGKYITVNYMLAKDSVQNRLDTGMSFTEFSYQLVQGYDFLWLFENKGVKLQMGGSDQWGNIVTGTELIRKKGVGSAFALTTPLIKKADGSKFGKSESGNIWLDPKKTSPFKFYQFWLNASDEDIKTYIRIFSLKGREEIEALEKLELENPGKRTLQKDLAQELTERVHSKMDLQRAMLSSDVLFGKPTKATLEQLSDTELLEVFEGSVVFKCDIGLLENGLNVLDLLANHTQIQASKSDAKRTIKGGGLSLNFDKIENEEQSLDIKDLLNNKYLLVKKGKKEYFLVIFE